MKRIPLVTLLVVALAMLVAGCGLLSQKTEPTSSAPPVKEVKMVHPSGIPVLMYHKIGDDKDNDGMCKICIYYKTIMTQCNKSCCF